MSIDVNPLLMQPCTCPECEHERQRVAVAQAPEREDVNAIAVSFAQRALMAIVEMPGAYAPFDEDVRRLAFDVLTQSEAAELLAAHVVGLRAALNETLDALEMADYPHLTDWRIGELRRLAKGES